MPPPAAAGEASTASAPAAEKAPPAKTAQEDPFAALRTLDFVGEFKIGRLKVNNLRMNNVATKVVSRKGVVKVDPMAAKLYEGGFEGSAVLDASVRDIAEIRSRRIVVATHMHAGDGNVHTNIPVHSHNYDMLHEAEQVVERIMGLATSLDGVISGEHGIGLGHKDMFEQEHGRSVALMRLIKRQFDPAGILNPGKLIDLQDGA